MNDWMGKSGWRRSWTFVFESWDRCDLMGLDLSDGHLSK